MQTREIEFKFKVMMKTRLLSLLAIICVCFTSCYDDSDLRDQLADHEDRIQTLETICAQMNTNINALQSIVNTLQQNDYVTNISPIMEGIKEIGYTISFSKFGPITIYHGKDGANGADGYTPKIGVAKDIDDIYYWTLDGEWMLDDAGNKIPAVGKDGAPGTDGSDGKDGQDGKDGVTPLLEIRDGYWYISYDNGLTYSLLGKVKEDKDDTGDSFFSEVYKEEGYLVIKLMDGSSFKIPYFNGVVPKLISFTLQSKYNPLWISSDINGEFLPNNIVECRIPNFVESKMFIPTFEFEGEYLFIDDVEVTSGETKVDFSKPVKITVSGENNDFVSYTLNVRAFTGLPVVYINTEGYKEVTSKDYYRNATFTLTEDIYTRAAGDSWTSPVKIKGRGNSTWTLPKKPYKIKFDEKVSVLGEPKAKSWLLLANYADKTMIRNATAFYMGYNSNLPYTTKYHFVDLFMNDVYFGTYQFCEDKEVGKNRIELSDNGYLLEIDAKAAAEDITFNISSIGQPINIKEPEVEVGSEAYNLIKEYLTTVESVLYSENFADPENGYAKYMDVETFVDWYLINEISKNNDAIFFTSCYMTYEPGGKLCMGPLWDFDIAFGNCNYNDNNKPEGFWIKQASWYTRLFEDPNFVKKVKERFNHFYSIKDDIYNEINENADYLKYSVIENDYKWNILYQSTWPNHGIWGSYTNEIQYMKRWLETRFEWLNNEFAKM